MKYLLKAVDTYRVDNVEEVDKLHQALLDDKNFELVAFSYTHKEIKSKGEVVEEYEVVKATKVFAEEKYPDIQYDVIYTDDPEEM